MGIWQLMKNLRDKGWIPRWYNEVIHAVYDKKHKMIWLYKEGKEYLHLVYKKSLRELVSKDSGLWQFVCENGMVKKLWDNFKYFYNSRDNLSTLRYYEDRYKYWLLESALKDESELEEFLLNSIIIDD